MLRFSGYLGDDGGRSFAGRSEESPAPRSLAASCRQFLACRRTCQQGLGLFGFLGGDSDSLGFEFLGDLIVDGSLVLGDGRLSVFDRRLSLGDLRVFVRGAFLEFLPSGFQQRRGERLGEFDLGVAVRAGDRGIVHLIHPMSGWQHVADLVWPGM